MIKQNLWRLENVYNQLDKLNLDGFFVSHQPNITYLTGFNSRDAYLLITKNKNFFITDFRYWYEAKKYLKGFYLKKINGSIFSLIVNLSKSLKIRRLGFETKYLSHAEYEKIKEGLLNLGIEFIGVWDLVEHLREIKSQEELKNIRKAIQINIEAFKYARRIIKPGLSERQIAYKLEGFIKNQGAKPAFEIIVAGGKNSSFCHYISGDYKIKNNDIVLIDMGVEYNGYKSDLTRIFFLGKIPFIFKKIYQIVKEAQSMAIKNIKKDITIDKIDKIARNYIKNKGWGKFFGHALGHGVGLEIHEEPYVSSKNKDMIKKDMVFTLEPAIYLPDRFGIRIEDMIRFDGEKAEVLSASLDK